MFGKAIQVRGVVQGVGFRPAVWRLAHENELQGAVWNDSSGVQIRIWGDAENLAGFIAQLSTQAPPLARIDSIEVSEIDSFCPYHDFRILTSQSLAANRTDIVADAATCPECLRELLDPNNRRYHYPFTNCTHCGPRFSIVQSVPYDRCNTSMRHFVLCSRCRVEYDDPTDRRFHAQANACPECGPRLWLENNNGEILPVGDAIVRVSELLKQGRVVAIKGIGGFHLACVATDEAAVAQLRRRKQRYHKPFALMAKDIAMIRRYAEVSVLEQAALVDKAAPIVLLLASGEILADSVAPDGNKLGFMLPYTPLHHCLLQTLDCPIVLTSGNRSEEPQCIANADARQQLQTLADYFLMHDRDILQRLDDSVIRISDGRPRLLRRARGFAPEVFKLPDGFAEAPAVLAMGGELKNSFCLLSRGQAVVSQYIGDLENPRAQADYRQQLKHYRQLYDFTPEIVAVDLHPDYLSTQLGRQWAQADDLRLVSVQHHHAHIAACMAEHGLALNTEVLGVSFDGLGMGLNRQLWGGEFLRADYRGFTRLAHLASLPLPGGVQAMREPWRNTYAQFSHYFDWEVLQPAYGDLEIIRFLASKPRQTLDTIIAKQLNSPVASSCGRFLDACAAAIGICRDQISYEGQAAIQLENLAAPFFAEQREWAYPAEIDLDNGLYVIGWQLFWQALLTDLQQRTDAAMIAARIHHGLARITVKLVKQLSQQQKLETVVLTGGVFQNRLLLEEISYLLRQAGITALSPAKLPANDGGLAFGQAVIAAARMI